MPRYRLCIEYDGTFFCGWQRQPNVSSVQQCLEDSLFHLTQESVNVEGAGRTDTGVHALGQVAHVDLKKDWDPFRLKEGLNFFLQEKGVSVLDVGLAQHDFHARFHATSRSYRYLIVNRRPPLVLEKNRAWHVMAPLDIEAMKRAAKHLIGYHNFQSFRSAHCQASCAFKTLYSIEIYNLDDHIITHLHAKSFLHNQVRIIMGTLVSVGLGKFQDDDMPSLLLQRDRTRAGPTAPAEGLYFLSVTY